MLQLSDLLRCAVTGEEIWFFHCDQKKSIKARKGGMSNSKVYVCIILIVFHRKAVVQKYTGYIYCFHSPNMVNTVVDQCIR